MNKKFSANIILVNFVKKDVINGDYILSLAMDNKSLLLKGEKVFENLLNYFISYKKTYPKRKKLIFYAPNGGFCFLYFAEHLKPDNPLFSLDSFLNAGTVYSFTLTAKECNFIINFKCLAKFTSLPSNLAEIKIEPQDKKRANEISTTRCKELQVLLRILGDSLSPWYGN